MRQWACVWVAALVTACGPANDNGPSRVIRGLGDRNPSSETDDVDNGTGPGSGSIGGPSSAAPMFVPGPGMHDAGPGDDEEPQASSDAGGGFDETDVCGMGTAAAALAPVNMMVMFDRSRSMNDDEKWPNATAALQSFFQDPGAAGLRIALRFFPADSPSVGCTKNGCDATACSEPMVELAPLAVETAPNDAQEQAIVDAVAASAPYEDRGSGEGTPIHAALDGALRWATSQRQASPDETTVVIFVTDGEPNGCDEDFTSISALAADALATSQVATYAIGLEGSSEEQMDQLALAGGTREGIFIGDSANAQQDLLAALDAIRVETLSCDFPAPEATDPDVPIDPAKVNVTFTTGDGMAFTLGQVKDAAACSDASAWHYDSPDSPTRIMLCPMACETVAADPGAKLEMLLGCDTLCGGLDEDCGGPPPAREIPPPLQ